MQKTQASDGYNSLQTRLQMTQKEAAVSNQALAGPPSRKSKSTAWGVKPHREFSFGEIFSKDLSPV